MFEVDLPSQLSLIPVICSGAARTLWIGPRELSACPLLLKQKRPPSLQSRRDLVRAATRAYILGVVQATPPTPARLSIRLTVMQLPGLACSAQSCHRTRRSQGDSASLGRRAVRDQQCQAAADARPGRQHAGGKLPASRARRLSAMQACLTGWSCDSSCLVSQSSDSADA